MNPRLAAALAVLIIVSVGAAGCLDDSNPLITDIPQVLMDYVNNATKIYVRGFSDSRYNNITICLQNRTGDDCNQFIMDNDTYYLGMTTLFTNFTMRITVYKGMTKFEYLGNVTVNEVNPIFTVEYGDKIKTTDFSWLPFKTAIKEVKDEQKEA
jgi:hypothetical protein